MRHDEWSDVEIYLSMYVSFDEGLGEIREFDERIWIGRVKKRALEVVRIESIAREVGRVGVVCEWPQVSFQFLARHRHVFTMYSCSPRATEGDTPRVYTHIHASRQPPPLPTSSSSFHRVHRFRGAHHIYPLVGPSSSSFKLSLFLRPVVVVIIIIIIIIRPVMPTV